MTKKKKDAKNSFTKSPSKEDEETIIYSAVTSDLAASNGAKEAFNQITAEARSVESVVVKETKTKMTTVSVVSQDAPTASVETAVNAEKTPETISGHSKPRASGWDNLFIKKKVSLELKKTEIPALEIEEVPAGLSLETSEIVTTNVMERILFEYFYQKITSIIMISIEVTNKVFRKKIGFGFISESKRYFKSKAVRVDKSLFFNQEKQSFVSSLSSHYPYSEVYNVWQTTDTSEEGKCFFILRHFLKWNSLTEEQRESLKVATVLDEGGFKKVVLVDPIFVDEEYVVIEQTHSTWFWVVSKLGDLPVRMRTMFVDRKRTSLTCSLSLRGLSLFQKLLLGSFSLEH